MDDKISNVGVETLPTKCSFYSRIGHRAVRMGDEALILGGTGPFGQFIKPIIRLNLENLKMEVVSNSSCPSLQGFSSFTHKDTLYLWGGNHESKPCNILWSFRGSNFDMCSQNGQIPSPRAFHQSVFIANRYLLVYGGFNDTEILNDWHVLDIQTFTWNNCQSNFQLPKNVKFRLIWGFGRGYLFSQCQVTRSNSKACAQFKNEVFQVRVTSFSNFKVRIDQLQYTQGQIPISRANFSLVYMQKYIWLLGGQIYNQNQSMFCNDIWSLDIQTMVWTKQPFLLNIKSDFEIIYHKNKLYIIGGIKSFVQMSNVVEIVNIANTNSLEVKICSFCKSVFSIQEQKTISKPNYAFQIQVKQPTQSLTQISTTFLSKLAHFIQNPIQAIGLLIDNCLNMGASLIYIKICIPVLSANYFKQNEPFLYMGDNSKAFTSEQITRIMFSFRYKIQKYYNDHLDKQDMKIRNQYGLNLKLASLRLGSSCLFVTTTCDDGIFVSYFSDVETYCPDGQPSFNCFFYVIDKNGNCSNPANKHIIKQNVKHLVDERQYLNSSAHNTKVFIFGLHDVVKSQGRNNKSDISYAYHHGVTLVSLIQYVNTLYLVPFLGRQIYIEQNRLSFINLASKFKQDERNGWIQQIDTTLQQSVFSKICLYRVIKSSYIYNYVYIFHQNRLIYTIASRQKLICGFIEVPELIQVDLFKSKIQKLQEEKKLIGYIESKQEPRRRLRRTQNHYQTEGQIRKVKPTYLNF